MHSTQATPRPHRPCCAQRGFTLVEILVVVVIVSVVFGVAVISLGSRSVERDLRKEALRIHELSKLASEQAIIFGLDVGIVTAKTEYAFLESSEQGWTPLDDGTFRQRALPDGMELDMLVEDLPLEQDEDASDDEDEAVLLPQAVFLTTGEITPFEIQIKQIDFDPYFAVRGDVQGRVTLTRIDPDAPNG